MSDDIKVRIVSNSTRKFFMMRFKCPESGKFVTQSTKIENTGKKRDRAAAERVAGKWEKELREGRYVPPSKVTWKQFRDRYEAEVLPGNAKRTAEKVTSVLNVVESVVNPGRLSQMTAERLSYLQGKLREMGRERRQSNPSSLICSPASDGLTALGFSHKSPSSGCLAVQRTK